MKTFLVALAFTVRNFLCTCDQDNQHHATTRGDSKVKIVRAGRLDKQVKECSGVAYAGEAGQIYTISDGANPAIIYKIDQQGNVLEKIDKISGGNVDWEDITNDGKKHLYIGDFGNNNNSRTDLRIYKYSLLTHTTDSILYSYPDQSKFPPDKENKDFDCEAIFWYQDSLYLISKNRSSKQVKVYSLPDQAGTYKATLRQRIFIKGPITGAAFHQPSATGAFTSYGRLYIFKFDKTSGSGITLTKCKRFAKSGQAEGLCFISTTNILVVNENRRMFLVTISTSKRAHTH